MPPPVRRFARVLVCVALLALALAGAALAGNGGFAPVAPASPNEKGIRAVYWLILGLTGTIFVLVEAVLLLFVVRYRSRGRAREVEGPQVIGHTKLELAWTAGPVVILAVIAAFVFYKVAGIRNASPAAASTGGAETIRIEGHQFYWEFVYPNGGVSIDTLRVPYNRKIELDIVSDDVAHSWWIPALGGKLDAIPGQTNRESFRATKLGTFRGQCAEFCGLQHAAMIAYVKVLPADRYDAWVQRRLSSPSEVGRETFAGVCAKCHGLAGQGDIGPAIAQSPLLADRTALTKLLRDGGIKMPAVGKTWGDAQLNATLDYLKKRFAGGGSGG
jgi:cytochrome c oxidase subunit 2